MNVTEYQQHLAVENKYILHDIELVEPIAKGHDLLVEVKANSVNTTDYKVRLGVPEDDWKVIGWDTAGIVKAVGEQVTLFKPGDKVWYAVDITRPVNNAEMQLIDERIAGAMPQTLSFNDATILSLSSNTEWEILFDRLQVSKVDVNKNILLIGAVGSVGSIIIKLLKEFTNLTIVASTSRPETVSWLKELGVDHIVNDDKKLSEEFIAQNLSPVDYVVSLHNTESQLIEIEKVLKAQGQLAITDSPKTLDIAVFKSKAISVHW